MIRINLLPQEDTPKSRNFTMPELGAFTPVAILLVALMACGGTWFMQKRTADRLTTEVAEARAESQRLAPQIARIKQLERERDALDVRLDAITSLDAQRYLRVHLLSEVARKFPDNAWLTGYKETSPSTIEIQGITFNNFVVADFLRDLDTSEYYDAVDLVISQRGKIGEVKVLDFTMTADVSQPAADLAGGL